MSSPRNQAPQQVEPIGVPTHVVARRFHVTTQTVHRWAQEGVIPPPVFRSPGRCLWDLVATEKAMAARMGGAHAR
jgi:hypothetical protein